MNIVALINKFHQVTDGFSIGTVISIHKTAGAAQEADRKYQKAIKSRAGSEYCYIPTRIVFLSKRVPVGVHVDRNLVIDGDEIDFILGTYPVGLRNS